MKQDFEPGVAEPEWSAEQTRRSDLSAVTEESLNEGDEVCGASATRGIEKCIDRETYSCEDCHCLVCKRSLERHDCQLHSTWSRSGRRAEAMSDEEFDDGGSMPS